MSETEKGKDSIATEEGEPSPSLRASGRRRLVFISYRVDPDGPLAEALKELIESAIEPTPEAFVSGAGGLRPSALLYPTQLQEAAKSADAFVGIITNASKDRAWIHFEAGAAWGRRRLYAPLLVDVSPGELESTIGVYQATRAEDEDAVRLLLEDLARAVAGTVKPRFGRRFGAFGRAVKKYRTGKSDPEGNEEEVVPGPSTGDPVIDAGLLLMRGRKQEAEARFKELEKAADRAVASRARITRIGFDLDRRASERLVALESLDAQDRTQPEYSFWHGYLEEDPRQAVHDLNVYMATAPSGPNADLAFRRVVSIHKDLGETGEASTLVADGLRSGDRVRRAVAAKLYCELWTEDAPLARLCAVVLGLMANPSTDLLQLGFDLTENLKWHALGVHFARQFDALAHDGSSANTEGIAYDRAELASRAYEAFKKSAKLGVTVAKVNMANLLKRGAVASAGLDLLQEHEGSFDSAAPHYPHNIRSDLEREVADQRKKGEALEEAGRRFFLKLGELVAEGLRSPLKDVRIAGAYRVAGRDVKVEPGPDGTGMIPGDGKGILTSTVPDQKFRRLLRGTSLYGSISGDPLVLVPRAEGFVGLSEGPDGDGTWVKWERSA